jgi:hypothetical protein
VSLQRCTQPRLATTQPEAQTSAWHCRAHKPTPTIAPTPPYPYPTPQTPTKQSSCLVLCTCLVQPSVCKAQRLQHVRPQFAVPAMQATVPGSNSSSRNAAALLVLNSHASKPVQSPHSLTFDTQHSVWVPRIDEEPMPLSVCKGHGNQPTLTLPQPALQLSQTARARLAPATNDWPTPQQSNTTAPASCIQQAYHTTQGCVRIH